MQIFAVEIEEPAWILVDLTNAMWSLRVKRDIAARDMGNANYTISKQFWLLIDFNHSACHLMNRLLCDDENDQSDSDEIQKPCKVPLFYDYTFGTVIANRSVPTGGQRLYRYRIPENKSFETFLKDFKVNYAANGVQIADNSFFQ